MLYNLKFWTDMEAEIGPDGKPTGEKVPCDWVSYGPAVIKGVASNNVLVSDKIRRLDPTNFKIKQGQDGGMTMQLVLDRWAAIEPYYRAWKEGRDVPVNGTPLAAWTTLRSEEVDALIAAKINTVEAVAVLTDNQCNGLPLPNAWGLRDLAKKFLEVQGSTKVSSEIQALQDQIKHLNDVIAGSTINKIDPVDTEVDALRAELEARGIEYDKRVRNPDKLRALLQAENEKAA